jgi:hypothetical protein
MGGKYKFQSVPVDKTCAPYMQDSTLQKIQALPVAPVTSTSSS